MTHVFGQAFRIAIHGESHGPAIGCSMHGIPAGTPLDLDEMQRQLDRRRPGQSLLTTQRKETDVATVTAGIHDGVATGAPIALTIPNGDTESSKYDAFRDRPRPGHSDFPAHVKYRGHNDIRGGGHFSGRLTAPLTAAGALARQTLDHLVASADVEGGKTGTGPSRFRVLAATTQIADIVADLDADTIDIDKALAKIDAHPTRCLDPAVAERMAEAVEAARRDQDSVGGVVTLVAEGLPVGLGEPFFDSVESVLSHLMFAVPAVKAVEFGTGFRLAAMRGSEANDAYAIDADGNVVPRTNHAGGAVGGITDGARLVIRVGVKPASSIARDQTTADLRTREETSLSVTGRHDPCIVVRAVPVIENVACIALLDLWLRARAGGWRP